MKTAEEILIDCYSYYGKFNDIQDIEDEITDEGVKAALKAMETYATQQTADLQKQYQERDAECLALRETAEKLSEDINDIYAQLQKAEQDKEAMAIHLKRCLEAINTDIAEMSGHSEIKAIYSDVLNKAIIWANQIEQTLKECGITA
jgi:chromosome segregation ATPase